MGAEISRGSGEFDVHRSGKPEPMDTGRLFLVSTPIGNLEDISLRALRILREASRVVCEDTRRTGNLLRHYQVATPMIPFHRFNEHRLLAKLVERLLAGENLALTTDGGTPLISDPGFSLVRAAVANGIPVIPVPGASALIAGVVGSGLPCDRILFIGFLPHRISDRRKLLSALRDREETLVFFDSPRRVAGSLEAMASILGDRQAALCREMTKLHEEFVRGNLEALSAAAGQRAMKGEITLVVEGERPKEPARVAESDLRREVEERVSQGVSRRDAVREVAHRRGLSRREIYRLSRPLPARKEKASDEEE